MNGRETWASRFRAGWPTLWSILFFTVSIGSTAAAPQFKFKMGHANPVDTPYDKTAKQFAQLAKEKTNGKVEISIFPNVWPQLKDMLGEDLFNAAMKGVGLQ